jgi:Sulfotransferase domain
MNTVARRARGLANRIGKLMDVALDRTPAGRNVTVLPGDIFIVSYPKSGNTWTRFLIGNLIYQDEPVTFANVERLVPSLYVHSDRKLRKLPRILKSHDCFDPRYRTVVYIVRDPRDVMVSAYHYGIKLGILRRDWGIEQFVPALLDGTFDSGLLANPRFGSWYDNVASWLAMRHNRKFLLLRYEDMLADPQCELAKVATFLDLHATPESLARAVQLSSADRMRELEKKQAADWALTKNTHLDMAFVRKATSGIWQAELPPQTVQCIESAWGSLMRRLRYKLVSSAGLEREKEDSVTPEEF